MAKLALKAQPTFLAKVAIPVPGGAPVEVEFTFKHRTRAELETYLAELRETKADGKGKAKAGNEEVTAVMNVAIGWEMDEPWNAENVGVFLENYHKAAWCIGTSYITELMQAREGN
jgi:hypothetical protein